MHRLLIVEDSAFMCQLIKALLAGENFAIEVASNGQEAIEKAKSFRPNVITMDIEMPVMSGLDSLSAIMAECPVPVIMVSALTMRGAEISVRSLEMGAFDIVAKPSEEHGQDVQSFQRELITKIRIALLVPPEKLLKSKLKTIAVAEPSAPAGSVSKGVPDPSTAAFPSSVVLIGASTGGPTALQTLLSALPKDFPVPILVVQHMPQNFTRLMAERLNSICQVQVSEAEDGDPVIGGRVLIAPGGMQMSLAQIGSKVVTRISTESTLPTPYKPSIDVLFRSVAEVWNNRVMAFVLTGMGSDGLNGCTSLKQKGATIVAESEETCIVYGMSKCVVEAGLADKVLPLPEIGRCILDSFARPRGV